MTCVVGNGLHQLNPLQMEPAIWNGRWQALDQSITDGMNILRRKEDKANWEITLESTLASLRAFGEAQFCFFQVGFQDGSLVDSPQLKAEFAIRQTLDQISFDLATLRKVQSQRHPDLSTERERNTLQLADQLAYRALKPAIDAGLIYPTTILTYFQKAAHVRVIPYAPVALIGIPYTCTGIYDAVGARVMDQNNEGSTHTARDFLAIAHEVGHHLFWHGKKHNIPLRALLRSKLPAEPAWRMRWLEEIFADVYGAIIAGPVLALDFQEIVYDNPDLLTDDGEHPIGAIRPFLYTDVLRRIKDKDNKPKFVRAPDKLDTKWRTLSDKRGKPANFRPKGADTGGEVPIFRARQYLVEVVDLILELLEDIELTRQDQVWSVDSDDPNRDLYEAFRVEILKQPDPILPKFQARPEAYGLEEVVMEADNNTIYWEVGKPLVKWFSLFTEAQKHGLTLLPETWNTLLAGGGWAAGGPEEDGMPK